MSASREILSSDVCKILQIYANGNIQACEFYRNGRLEGERKVWYEDGGGRLVIKDNSGIYWMYGHLDSTILPMSTSVREGDIIGKIGNSNVNGGWFPHLHLQVMTEEFVGTNPDWRKIDGYATSLPEGVLDPIKIIS